MTEDDKALVRELRTHQLDSTMAHEAADRIEALSAENERLREQHDAFRREVSDALSVYQKADGVEARSIIWDALTRFIIAKPDPLEKLLQSIAITLDANDLREALDDAGLEVREKSNG